MSAPHIMLASLPSFCKNIKTGANLKKFWQKQFCTAFWDTVYSLPAQVRAKDRAKFGWLPFSDVAAVTKPRRESVEICRGAPNYIKWSQPLVCWSSPYYGDMWRRYCCLTSFFLLSIRAFAKIARQSCATVPRRRLFGDFLRPVFSASCVQHISGMHSKFALRPHHVWKYGRHPICDGWDNARKKEETNKERNHRAKI